MNNFITNINTSTLKKRLEKLITASQELKFLVGFFYFSGWQEIYQKLQENESVTLKVLVGLQVDKHLSQTIELGIKDESLNSEEHFAQFMKSMGFAINNAEMDSEAFYNQVAFFIELLEAGRLKIRKTRNPNHAKLYLFHLEETQKDLFNTKGEFITGSSNLTKAGLHGQEEFNVELRDYGYETAEKYFDDLWDDAVAITENEEWKKRITEFLKGGTQSAHITPFEAYALILKTYVELQEAKKIDDVIINLLEKNGFEKYQYQLDAVSQALSIIEKEQGVIIADVVGLGKSVIASLIAKQLKRRGLILCPPSLIGNPDENSGWYEYKNRFELYDWDIESSGNLENIAERIRKHNLDYEVIIVDEAHKFRNQDTSAYADLQDICRGKKVILLTATPFNNSPADVFSLLKLFLIPGKSSITLENDLEGRFSAYNYRFKQLSHIIKNHNSKDEDKRLKAERSYTQLWGVKPPIDIDLVRENVASMAKDIKSTISSVVIRRNRIDLTTHHQYKKEIQNLSVVKDPKEQFFELSAEQSDFYDRMIKKYFAENGNFRGAIYRPFEYEKKPKDTEELNEEDNRAFQQQRNLFDFMRRLLVKRFESSFGAFEQSIERFLRVHKMVHSFIQESNQYVLDRKVIDSIYDDNDNADDFSADEIEKALKDFKERAKTKTKPKHTKIYNVKKFYDREQFIKDIESDIQLFEEIKTEIDNLQLINGDPKRKAVVEAVKEVLNTNKQPKRKVIIFTEYTDTVRHLKTYFEKELKGRVLVCEGSVTKSFAQILNANFNAKNEEQKDDYDVLITSDKLSEGHNLNRAGLIINYDIPWNPTRVIQRVGRINRMSAKVFDELFIYNFFPTEKGSDVVKIRKIAQQKMFLIHNALGEDAKIFDENEEPTASGLYTRFSKNPEQKEASIDTFIKNAYHEIQQKHPEVIERIQQLPNRTKTAKAFDENNVVVLRKKGASLFPIIHQYEEEKSKPQETNIEDFIRYVKCDFEEKRLNLDKHFWKSYEIVKKFKPQYNSNKSEIATENQALLSLKTLLKSSKEELDAELITFVGTLIEDLKEYKTLSKDHLRHLKSPKGKNAHEKLIENIKALRYRIGADYLDKIKTRISNIEEDVIIAVGNLKRKTNERMRSR